MRLKKRNTINNKFSRVEFKQGGFVPYVGHYDDHTILTDDNELIMVIKLQGFSFETADDEDVDMRKNIRNTLFKSVAAGDIAMWFHIIRKRRRISIEGEYENIFCKQLQGEWSKKHDAKESFVNELYVTLVQRQDSEGISAKSVNAINFLAKKASAEALEFEMRNNHRNMMDLANRLVGSLKDYRPKLLGVERREDGNYSEIMEFLGMLVNCGEHAPMRVPYGNAARYLSNTRLYFGKRAMEARSAGGRRWFAGAVSVKEYAPFTAAGILDSFLKLPFEFIISQSFEFSNRQAAIGRISLKQRRMQSSMDKGMSQADELTIAMDMATSGHIGFGNHNLSIVVMDEDLKQLEAGLSLCYGELVNRGINPSREVINMQATYWAQLPANFRFIARRAEINTLNLAGFASLHNYPTGSKEGNHWGPAVTIFNTTSGTPFFFNFHVRDVGHTTIIGPTGAGKTVLLNFLVAQAQKFGARLFYFDKDRGAEIFIRAIEGHYNIIQPGEMCGFNPLQLEDTHENRTFLFEWMRAMATAVEKQDLTSEDNERITDAINGNYKLNKEDRILRNIIPFLGLETPGSLAARMRPWYSGATHAGIFDNAYDTVDFESHDIFAFEMNEVLNDGISIAPTLLYLFHRIQKSLDGRPTMIVLDEAWALIDNDVFAPKIKDWLKTLRKLNAMVVFATQSVEDTTKSNISDTLVQQTATQIFLPNHKATQAYKDMFMLTQREYLIIRTTEPGSRYFLLKQGYEVVVARIDLSGLDYITDVLSGRADTVRIVDKIRAEVGDDPNDWLPIFYEHMKKLRESEEEE